METVYNLKYKTEEYLDSLGIEPSFKNNPAYAKVVDTISSLIPMHEDTDRFVIGKDGNAIVLSYTNSETKIKDTVRIYSPTETQIYCVRTTESIRKEAGKEINEKLVVFLDAHYYGKVDMTTIYGVADDKNCEYNRCNYLCSIDRKEYDKYGVQEHEEIKNSPILKSTTFGLKEFDSQKIENEYKWANTQPSWWEHRTTVHREKLDVAYVTFENRKTGEKYTGLQPINQEHGLQDLSYSTNWDEHIIINGLLNSEIEEMLSKEDPKVAEGLRAYTNGRESLSYDSELDKRTYYVASKV